MKKILLYLITITLFVACKNEVKSDVKEEAIDVSQQRTEKQSDGLTLLKGEFIYYADAAVLQTHRQMYAVVLDEKMHELDEMAKAFKKEATDFVQVEIRGKITPKPDNEEGWPYRVEIKEILNVKAAEESSEVVKLGTE
ncbi:MAG: hypothetical protein R2785_08115 [Flavobacteriaceae bacterium]